MNVDSALVRLYAWQTWYRPSSQRGRPYGMSLLMKAFKWAPGALGKQNRKTILRPALAGKCIGCGGSPSTNSTGDHIIPLADGGPDSAENHAPFCRSCNASKGKKDLLEWWFDFKKKKLLDLNIDVLTAYLRLRHRYTDVMADAPSYLETAVEQASQTMPPDLAAYFLDPARDAP